MKGKLENVQILKGKAIDNGVVQSSVSWFRMPAFGKFVLYWIVVLFLLSFPYLASLVFPLWVLQFFFLWFVYDAFHDQFDMIRRRVEALPGGS